MVYRRIYTTRNNNLLGGPMFNLPICTDPEKSDYCFEYFGDGSELAAFGFTAKKLSNADHEDYYTEAHPLDGTFGLRASPHYQTIEITSSTSGTKEYSFVNAYLDTLPEGAELPISQYFRHYTNDKNIIEHVTIKESILHTLNPIATQYIKSYSTEGLIRTYYKIGKILGLDQTDIRAKLNTFVIREYHWDSSEYTIVPFHIE